MQSIFTDKEIVPTETALKKALGDTYSLWEKLDAFTKQQYPQATVEWNYSSAKFGWGYRIKDKKRVLVYLLPRDGFFKVALVFGQKAFDEIMDSSIAESIKTELRNAKPYAEGRGIRVDVKDDSLVNDIEALISIKISN
jgi:hypothetical protein